MMILVCLCCVHVQVERYAAVQLCAVRPDAGAREARRAAVAVARAARRAAQGWLRSTQDS